MTNPRPTPQQTAIFEAGTSLSGSILIDAVPGSGKTWTLVELAKKLPANVQGNAIAFNKKTALTLQKKLPPNITAATMNSAGHRAWAAKIGHRPVLNTDKAYNIVSSLNTIPSRSRGDVLRLLSIARNFGIVPRKLRTANSILPDEPEIWFELAELYEADLTDELLAYTRLALTASIKSAFSGTIDYSDQLYMSVCFAAPFSKQRILLIDEAQDLSSIQHAMIRRMCLPHTTIIAAGDPNQAIYAFRGALSDSMPQLASAFSMTTYPLTFSFRCPRAIVREAQLEVPYIESSPSATEGTVETYNSPTNPLPLTSIPRAVLCRNTAPLLTLSLRLIASGIGATVLGREIGAGLSRMIDKITKKTLPTREFLTRLDNHIAIEITKRPKSESALIERREALHAISSSCSNSDQLKKLLKRLYSSKTSSPVTLSTIHKAKGLEWPEVLFLDRQLIPSAYATQEYQLIQERNLSYIAKTRSMNRLAYATSYDIQ